MVIYVGINAKNDKIRNDYISWQSEIFNTSFIFEIISLENCINSKKYLAELEIYLESDFKKSHAQIQTQIICRPRKYEFSNISKNECLFQSKWNAAIQ